VVRTAAARCARRHRDAQGGAPRGARIVDAAPDTAIVLLSGQWSRLVNELIDAGAIGFRRKGIAPQVLAEALIESIRIHTAERRESMWALLGWTVWV